MTPLTLALLRRVTGYALVLAVLALTLPRLLTTLGVLGPSIDDEIAAAGHALEAARAYGATSEDPSYARAEAALARARELASRSSRIQAKRATAEAQSLATEAQRLALARREDARRQAQKVVVETDRMMNDLEDVYSEVTRSLDKPTVARLFSTMKATRQKAAALWLAFEEGNYARVTQDAPETRDVLLAAKAELRAAGRAGAGPAAPRSEASPRP